MTHAEQATARLFEMTSATESEDDAVEICLTELHSVVAVLSTLTSRDGIARYLRKMADELDALDAQERRATMN